MGRPQSSFPEMGAHQPPDPVIVMGDSLKRILHREYGIDG